MSVLTFLARIFQGENPEQHYRTPAEIEFEKSQMALRAVQQKQEANRRAAARLRALDLELQVITRRHRDPHSR